MDDEEINQNLYFGNHGLFSIIFYILQKLLRGPHYKLPEPMEGFLTEIMECAKPNDNEKVILNEAKEMQGLLVQINKDRDSISVKLNIMMENAMRDNNGILRLTEEF